MKRHRDPLQAGVDLPHERQRRSAHAIKALDSPLRIESSEGPRSLEDEDAANRAISDPECFLKIALLKRIERCEELICVHRKAHLIELASSHHPANSEQRRTFALTQAVRRCDHAVCVSPQEVHQ